LWESALCHGRKAGWKYIELREKTLTENPDKFFDKFYMHTLNLNGNEETVLKQFRTSTKRNIRKAQKSGVTTRISKAYSDVMIFYKLNCMTRKEHGLPPQPLLFFRKLFQHVIKNGMGFIVIAEANDRPIAGAVFLSYGNQAIYKYGASDKRYQGLRANNLVMWNAIKEFIGKGFHTFHFGRTEPHHNGLLQFKRGWGTQESELYYYRYDLHQSRFVVNAASPKSSYRLFSRLPIPVLKMLGRLLYRHVG
jgi:lipid II:glycine glycyltransferase (peptidoglycan interpeptide bridge formation enzyme)